MRPEGAAIFAVAPALIFKAAGAISGLQVLLRDTVQAILGAVEAGKMLADNLFRHIAFGALCPGIPVHHVAVMIEHIDSVIGNALHQQAEAHLLLPLFALLLLLLSTVAGYTGVSHQQTGIIAYRVDRLVCPESTAIFAIAPAFAFMVSGSRSHIQPTLRQAPAAIFFAIQQGKAAANHFVWRIAYRALSTLIPAADDTVRF